MKKQDIVTQLNEVLEFMLSHAGDVPNVTPQHIIQHFQNIGVEITLVHAISLFQTLQGDKLVSEFQGFYSITVKGKLLIQLGGFRADDEITL